MIYTVSFNPSLDYVVDVPQIELGRVNRAQSEILYPGGKGINVSIVLTNLGIENEALGFIAGFVGETLEMLLAKKGIKTDFIRLPEGVTRINVKIRAKEETELNGKGPFIEDCYVQKLYDKLDRLNDKDVLVLAGSIPDCMPKSSYMDIMKRLADKNIPIVVDATKELLVNVLPYKPFLVKPNNHELGEVFGVTIKTKEAVVQYAKELANEGARNILVSMAGEGAVLLAEDGSVYMSDAPVGVLKNSVGAGDSMVAGFLAGYLQTGSYEKAFQMGVCTGSASAFSEELATKEEVMSLLHKTFHL
ncbi:MAG: 1-phosphofructokinase [Lachnospiraceae bacterium]|nr:1-phosphofructokinase [Lachnospiraceae bacterium]